MDNDDHRNLNLDQQIKFYEDRISRLEELKRTSHGVPSRVNEDLDRAYRQVALLKIRKMMNMTA